MFTHLKQTVKLVTYSLKWGKKEPNSSSNISQEDISLKNQTNDFLTSQVSKRKTHKSNSNL